MYVEVKLRRCCRVEEGEDLVDQLIGEICQGKRMLFGLIVELVEVAAGVVFIIR